MTLKKWGYLFRSTLLIGAIASLATGFFLLMFDTEIWTKEGPRTMDIIFFIVFNAGIGFLYSVFAQMGFFAYLTLNYIARSIIKRKLIWQTTQWILIVIVFFDVIYLRHINFDAGILAYSVLPIVIFIIAILVALLKSKQTNPTAFTPTVFFIFAITILEVVPALKQNLATTTLLAIIPVLCCNVWQIMKLHTILETEKES